MGIPGDEVTVENDHTSLAVRVFSLGQIRPMVYSRNSFALFWDDRAGSLEHQSTFPVEGPVEMDRHWDDAIREIQSHPIYPEMFESAFGSQHVTIDRVTRAIAQFERTF
jgi:cytochrome c peroxidase